MATQVIDVDEADITVLEENMEKTRNLCSSIQDSLIKLKSKSLQLEQRIKPLLNDTTKLNLYKSNIEQCLALIDNVKVYAASAANMEKVLNNQQMLYTAGVDKYIQSLIDAKSLLQEVNQTDVQHFKGIINSLKSSLKIGELNLKTFLELNVNKNSKSFDPQKLISSNQPFPYLETEQIRQYRTILNYFLQNSQPIDNVFLDSRSKQIVDSMLILEPFTKPDSKSQKLHYEKGSNGITSYTEALVCFIENEKSLLQEFYGEGYQTHLYQVVEASLNIYNKIIKSLFSYVEGNIASDGYLTFELIDSLNKVLKETPMDSPSYMPLKKSLDTGRLLTQSLFLEFLKAIDARYSSMQSIPNDTSVSDITVETMSRLRKLSDYRDPSLIAIGGMKPGSWIPTNPKPIWVSVFSSVAPSSKRNESSDPKFLLSSFYSDSIDAILISLEAKAKALLKRSSLGYFLITNFFVVETIIQRSDIPKILGTIGQERLARIKKRFLGFFLESWKKVAAHLMDVTIINTDKSSQSKEKDIIKEKFKKFNEEFDELVKVHKSFRITDASVKSYLSGEISFIMPLYHRFHDKYAGDYFKHTEKYIRWNNEQFDQLVKSL